MSTNANITLDRKDFVAELGNGQYLAQPDLRHLAEALHQAGVSATETQYDRRDGRRMLTAGQQVALCAALREFEHHHARDSLVA